jgi:predicted transcriptional regulator
VTKVLSLRVPDDLAEWADGYAAERGVTRQALIEGALVSFREDCEAGVPELREAARRQSSVPAKTEGVGECPFHEGGHVFAPPSKDPLRRCEHCGLRGRGPKGEDSFLQTATSERALLFARLRAPESAHGRAKKP